MDYQFKNIRPGVHDTGRHLQLLEDSLNRQKNHPRYKEIRTLGIEILNQAETLNALPNTETRKVHGDPKINNFLFKQDSLEALCMLDFDTLSNMQIILELGDAMRSWCNPNGEDEPSSIFLLESFQAGLEGYQKSSNNLLTDTEWTAILPATLTIYMELAARFCADALNENYFAWAPDKYQSHSEHSQARATSQLNAAKSLLQQYKDAECILNQLR
jgi:Ser/Thr protein kinase RdoA (MazF antagonist)